MDRCVITAPELASLQAAAKAAEEAAARAARDAVEQTERRRHRLEAGFAKVKIGHDTCLQNKLFVVRSRLQWGVGGTLRVGFEAVAISPPASQCIIQPSTEA